MDAKIAQRKTRAARNIEVIKKFAHEMGYEIWEEDYVHDKTGRPAHLIEIEEIWDIDGNPYSWAWYTDTWEEM